VASAPIKPPTIILDAIATNIAFSQYLKDECAAHRLRYFDTSRDFVLAHE
jgi:hypothetical protein